MEQFASYFTLSIYGTLVLSYIWARLEYFSIQSRESRIRSYFYDPIVAIHVISTTYFFLTHVLHPLAHYMFASAAFFTSFLVFWWGIKTCNQLNFAFAGNVGKLITSGPFQIVRHPFYFSYIVTWATSTFLFPSIPLWITLMMLTYFYVLAAVKEENAILSSDLKSEYKKYIGEVGMFLPKATQWKKWFSELSRMTKR